MEDAELGAHLARIRADAGITLEEVAKRMAERGYAWQQSTAWKIEHGQRALKAHEVLALSDILEVTVFELLNAPSTRAQAVAEHAQDVMTAGDRLQEAVRAMNGARIGWNSLDDEDRALMAEFAERPEQTAVNLIDAMTIDRIVRSEARQIARALNARRPEDDPARPLTEDDILNA